MWKIEYQILQMRYQKYPEVQLVYKNTDTMNIQ